MLESREAEAVLTIACMAALADGRTSPEEREQVRSLLETLAAEHDLPNLARVQQQVVLRQAVLSDEINALHSGDARRTAFEIAVCVADADGRTTAEERSFLDELEKALGLDHAGAVAFEQEAEAIAESTVDTPLDASALLGPSAIAEPARAIADSPTTPDPIGQEVDRTILKYAVLNGALELLPQNLATMAILPLQTRMVYAIGKQYGHTLGAGHIKEFIATIGVGATSQMLENFARKTLGKLAKKTLGKTASKAVKVATGPMMTFATTYAMGSVAKAYYSGGRTLSAVDLRSMFQRDLAQGKAVYEQHRPQVEQQAGALDAGRVLDLVRGRGRV